MKNKNFFKINIIYFVAMILVAIIFVLGSFGLILNDIFSSFLIQIVVMFAVPLLLYSLFVSKSAKQTFSDFGVRKISGKMLMITIGLGFVLYFINNFTATLFSSIIHLFGYENISSSSTVKLDYTLLLKEFALSAILPGICEEFLHRGMMLFAGKKSGNTKFCLFASSILFGLMHLNINQFFYAAILGFLMGIVALAANSIIPTMIIHFMNNFLSSYFYYGYYLDWPFAKLANSLETALLSNVFLYVIAVSLFIFTLIWLYSYLLKLMLRERARYEVNKIIKCFNFDTISIEEAQAQVDQVNQILEKSNLMKRVNNKTKFNFLEKSFFFASLILGGLITISSFIWGII